MFKEGPGQRSALDIWHLLRAHVHKILYYNSILSTNLSKLKVQRSIEADLARI